MPPDRFASKYIPEPNSGCWLWRGSYYGNGYARIYWRSKERLAHRVSYELHKGPIPPGFTIDHLCRVKECVNPDHLEAVTMKENILRGDCPSARRARQTHCIHGHLLSTDNLVKNSYGRHCKTCLRLWQRADRAKRRLSPKPELVLKGP